jgi:hypothetical protein
LTFAVAFVPYLFGGTLLSALVDWIAPRRMLIGCDLASGALIAMIALPGAPPKVLVVPGCSGRRVARRSRVCRWCRWCRWGRTRRRAAG